MRDDWLETTFRDFASLEKGISYKSSELCDEGEGMPFINLKSIDRGGGYRADGLKWYSGKFKSSQVVEPGDLILCCTDLTKQKAILGYPILVPAIGYSRFCISLDLAKILVDEKKILKSFLFLLLQDRRMREFMQSRSSGTTVMHLKTSEVPDVQVELPPLPEQKRIVDLISSVDSYINALQQQIESAKRSRNAVLHELLTVGGEGWVETTLDGIAQVVMGQSPDGKSYNQESKGLPFMQGSAEFGEHNPVPEKWCSDPKKIAEPGDLLLSVRAPVGDTNFADQRIAVGRGLSIIRANKESLTEFIRLVIQLNVAELIASSGSGMFASITGKNLKEFKVNLPPLPEQKRIVEIINTIDEVIAKTALTTNKAIELRSGLLSDLLSGEHEIPDSYDKVIGAA